MNENHLTAAKAGIAAFLGALTAFWGWFGWLVVAWVGLMLADWLIGSAAAMKRGEWSSAKLREGAWHKGGEVVIVIVALVADWLIGILVAQIPAVHLPFTYSVLLGPLVIVWYIVGELGSLAEHAVTFGAPVPSWLVNILAAGKKAVDTAGNKISDGVSVKTLAHRRDRALDAPCATRCSVLLGRLWPGWSRLHSCHPAPLTTGRQLDLQKSE